MLADNKSLGLIAGVVAIAVVAIAASFWILTPKWQPVLGETANGEVNVQAKNLLMEWGIPFKEDENTGYLLVQENIVGEVRSKLSAVGVPAEYQPGLELFDKSEYGMSEFTQRINYQRAIEAEIARTIRSFVDVRMARVHLTIPKESIFKDRQVKPKASVVIQSKNDQIITEDQVQGIAKLVASAVEGLEEGSVIVLNEDGAVLFGNDTAENGVKKQYSNRNIEHVYKEKVKDLVSGIVQTSNVNVAVNATINFDKVRSIKEQVLPRNEEVSGHLKKKRHQTTKASTSKNASGSGNGSIEEEYIFSTEKSEIEYASGQIEKLTVGIVVAKKIDKEVIEDIKSVVVAGLGLQLDRGDLVTVVSVEPLIAQSKDVEYVADTQLFDSALASKMSNQPKFDKLNIYLLIALGVLLLLLILVLLLKNSPKTDASRLSDREKQQLLNETKAWLASGK